MHLSKYITHNIVINRLRQILCGWKREVRHGVVIWYKPIKNYPGYAEYDYNQMLERACRAARQNRKKYPGMKVAIKIDVFYSGGRPGIGTRTVGYTIMPYRKVF